MADEFDVRGALRRIRRMADVSQRQLAAAVGVSAAAVSHAEAGRRDLPTGVLARAAALAGLRLALLDPEAHEVAPMADDTVRDMAGRRFPAHLDTRYGDDGWWHGPHRYDRPQPWYTFDRDRRTRDRDRQRTGIPEDHLRPRPGDSPAARAEARRRQALRERAEQVRRRFEAGELAHLDAGLTCTCPRRCDELDDWSGRPVHTDECRCRCDVG